MEESSGGEQYRRAVEERQYGRAVQESSKGGQYRRAVQGISKGEQ